MEDHKVSRSPHVLVRNRFTIFLCEEDWSRLGDHRDRLADKLERHLGKHVRAKRYQLPGELSVDITCDPDLRLGHFGILAESDTRGSVAAEDQAWAQAAPRSQGPGGPAGSVRRTSAEPVGSVRRAAAESVSPAGRAAPEPTLSEWRSAAGPDSGATKVIPPAEAAKLGLAREIMVVKSGNRVLEFSQGRVVIGRGADADFRIDNPDVSRRHAALSWSNGEIVLEDLGSTNGTMVNGYPVSSAVVSPDDVIVIGGCRLTVDAG